MPHPMSDRSNHPSGLFLVGLLAVAAGATVANLYYSPPILETIARQFAVSTSAASMIVTLTQLGYASSLLLVVPLGDMFERRRLIVMAPTVSTLMLVAVALSSSFHWMLVTSFFLKAASVAPQLADPYSSGLAGVERRPRIVRRDFFHLVNDLAIQSFLNRDVGDLFILRRVLSAQQGIDLHTI
jgi:MFS family permease